MSSLNLRAALLSVLIFLALLGVWHLATTGGTAAGTTAGMTAEEIEYARLTGKDPGAGRSGGGCKDGVAARRPGPTPARAGRAR